MQESLIWLLIRPSRRPVTGHLHIAAGRGDGGGRGEKEEKDDGDDVWSERLNTSKAIKMGDGYEDGEELEQQQRVRAEKAQY